MVSTTVAPGSLVLLTGASGFLAAHVGLTLLKKGFVVRGTVRSSDKGEYLDKLYESEGFGKDKWSWVIVKDLEGEGAFMEAIKGVDAVEHTASPFHFKVNDPHEDLINPAVSGTLSLLKAALTEPKVKRVVITSSNAAVASPQKPDYTFTEKDWNLLSPKIVEEKGKDAPAIDAYKASKTLAEQAAWKFVKDNSKDGVPPFEISTVNPPMLLGPSIHQCPSPDSINTSIAPFWGFITGTKGNKDALATGTAFADVRDVAKIHVEALTTEKAGGERFIVTTDRLFYQKFLDFLHEPAQAELMKPFPNMIPGVPGATPDPTPYLSAAKAQETFAWKPIDWKKTVTDMVNSLAERQAEWKAAGKL